MNGAACCASCGLVTHRLFWMRRPKASKAKRNADADGTLGRHLCVRCWYRWRKKRFQERQLTLW